MEDTGKKKTISGKVPGPKIKLSEDDCTQEYVNILVEQQTCELRELSGSDTQRKRY